MFLKISQSFLDEKNKGLDLCINQIAIVDIKWTVCRHYKFYALCSLKFANADRIYNSKMIEP